MYKFDKQSTNFFNFFKKEFLTHLKVKYGIIKVIKYFHYTIKELLDEIPQKKVKIIFL